MKNNDILAILDKQKKLQVKSNKLNAELSQVCQQFKDLENRLAPRLQEMAQRIYDIDPYDGPKEVAINHISWKDDGWWSFSKKDQGKKFAICANVGEDPWEVPYEALWDEDVFCVELEARKRQVEQWARHKAHNRLNELSLLEKKMALEILKEMMK